MYILMYAFQNAEGTVDGMDAISVSVHETHAKARQAICDIAREWAEEKDICFDVEGCDTEALMGWLVDLDERDIPSLDFSVLSIEQLLKDQNMLAAAARVATIFMDK